MKCPSDTCTTEMTEIKVERVYGTLPGSDVFELLIPEEVTIYTCPTCNHAIIKGSKEQTLVEVPEQKIIIAS